MSTLREILQRVEANQGENSPLAQAVRNQIMAEERGQSFRSLYLTGSVKFQDKQPPKKA